MTSKTWVAVCAALLLAACGAPKTRQSPESGISPSPAVSTPEAAPAGAAVYRIDAAKSEVRLLVYRAGPMARLGHNHVIVNRAVSGWVDVSGSFRLLIPAAGFNVDDAAVRAEEGADFSPPVPEEARSGTLHNMLSASLLDADRYPAITVSSISIARTEGEQIPGSSVATVSVDVAGHASKLVIPITVDISAEVLSASGSAMLRQTDLGLTPFSVLMGALQVQDELTVKFKFIAERG